MALRKIVYKGDSILKKRSKEVKEITPRIGQLIGDMWETMVEYNGIGLAAPQVGILKRIVIIDVSDPKPDAEDADGAEDADDADTEPSEPKQTKFELINPVIIEAEGEMIESEGCLSIPGVTGKVKRPEKVTVRALDADGNEITVTGEGLLAKALCHEIDHLEGILFTDIAVETTEDYADEDDEDDDED